MKPAGFFTVFVGAALGGYIACAAVGVMLPAEPGDPLTESEAVLALRFSFGDLPQDQWEAARGTASHRPFMRRAFIEGTLGGNRYSEQVLKVGWPFTMVRGFVRTEAGSIERSGAAWLDGDALTGPVGFLPLLPVWPGLVFNGLILTLPLLGIQALATRQRSGESDPNRGE